MTNELTTKPETDAARSKPMRVTGKLKAVCDAMVWEGMPWDKAALKLNFRTRSMRLAMQRPHVLRYIAAQRRVLLAQSSGQNLHRLGELRDQDSNPAAAVQAARALEALAIEARGGPSGGALAGGPRAGYIIGLSGEAPTTAGLVIVVNHPPAQPAARDDGLTIDVTPNRSSEEDRH
jgi:hypothetical protein